MADKTEERSVLDHERVTKLDDGTIEVVLEKPLRDGETKTISSLSLRPLKGGMLRKLPPPPFGASIGNLLDIGAAMSGTRENLINELGSEDSAIVCNVVYEAMRPFREML